MIDAVGMIRHRHRFATKHRCQRSSVAGGMREATKPAAANVLQRQARFDAFISQYNTHEPIYR
jgi:hypothetical protein